VTSHKNQLRTVKTSILNKKLNPFKVLSFILLTILALFIYLVLSLFLTKTKTPHKSADNRKILVSNTPTLEQKSKTTIKEQIIWMVFHDSYNNSKFWFEIPYPGPYCDACFDYAWGVTDSQSLSVIGGEFNNNSSNWVLISTIANQKGKDNQEISKIPIETIYSDLTKTPIGKSTSYSNSEKQKIEIIHKDDKQIENIKIFIAEIKSNLESTSQIAIFKQFDNIIVISFNNAENIIYKDVFNHIIDTFSFKKIEGTKYIDLCRKYSAYPVDLCEDY
jgi:hypothetical protein